MSEDEENEHPLESLKLSIDTVKHITTLASGTIVFAAAIFDKLPKPTKGLDLLGLCIVFMLLCVLSSTVYLFGRTVGKNKIHEIALQHCPVVIYFSFGSAIFNLGAFILWNLWIGHGSP
jgi:hypothetical protein